MEQAVCGNYALTAGDGKTYQTVAYNLEVIAARANAAKPNMGSTTWSGGKVRKHDVHVAKNYLNEEEMGLLNLTVTQSLDFAEFQARTRKAISYARLGEEAG